MPKLGFGTDIGCRLRTVAAMPSATSHHDEIIFLPTPCHRRRTKITAAWSWFLMTAKLPISLFGFGYRIRAAPCD